VDGSDSAESEVAERLRVCTATVYKLRASGAIEHVRVVNSICVTEAALRVFVATHSWTKRSPNRQQS
jgi:hypothetical protein